MNAPPAGRTFVIFAALYIFANLLILSVLSPALPAPGLDPSWSMVLGYAFERGWHFGRDIVFTYGPLGFIAANQYVPGLEILPFLYWLALHGLIAAALCVLYRGAWWPALLFLAVVSFLLAPVTSRDGYVFAAMLLLYLTARRTERIATAVSVALTVLMAAAAVMKTTYLAAAPVFVVLADVERRRRGQKIPLHSLIFLSVVLTSYLAAGQSPAHLGAYLLSAWDMAAGYNAAMQTPGDPVPYVLYGLLCTVVLGALVLAEGRTALLPATACAACLFFAGKAGFVRQDSGHMVIAWTAVVLAALACLGRVSARPRTKGDIAVVIELALVAVAGVVFASLPVAPGAPLRALARQVEDAGAMTARQVRTLISPGEDFAARYEERLAAIRRDDPLPALPGTVDIFPVDQAAVIAAGLNYTPRPVFQSYSAYTPRLIAKNRDFFAGANAPDHVLFKIASLDDRFPALDDGALWPEILRRYDSAGLHGHYLLLNRREAPREVTLETVAERTLAFGETVDLSPWRGDALWAELEIRASGWGALEGALLRPPPLHMSVTVNGAPRVFRVVPGMAEDGFLISPMIETARQFGSLVEEEPDASASIVESFSIAASPHHRSSFRDTIHLRLKRLVVAP